MKQIKFPFFVIVISIIVLSACKKDEKEEPSSDPVNILPPVELSCDYFEEDRVLTHDPNKTVDYIINCKMGVNAKVTIEPGVVIEFTQDAGLSIPWSDGTVVKALIAKGTEEKPIVFRGVIPEKGFWRGLLFNSNSTLNELKYVRIEDAGGIPFNSNNDRGAVIIYEGGALKMDNCRVTNSASYGFNANYREHNLVVTNNTFTNNQAPALISVRFVDALDPSNSYKGNDENYISLNTIGSRGSIISPSTWHKADVPYRIVYGEGIGFSQPVTISPGVVIEMSPASYLSVSGTNGGIRCIGTPEDPIIFTGVHKVQKAWESIRISNANAINEIAFTDFYYGGLPTSSSTTSIDAHGTIRLYHGEHFLNIHDVNFFETPDCAIRHRYDHINLTVGPNMHASPSNCITSFTPN